MAEEAFHSLTTRPSWLDGQEREPSVYLPFSITWWDSPKFHIYWTFVFLFSHLRISFSCSLCFPPPLFIFWLSDCLFYFLLIFLLTSWISRIRKWHCLKVFLLQLHSLDSSLISWASFKPLCLSSVQKIPSEKTESCDHISVFFSVTRDGVFVFLSSVNQRHLIFKCFYFGV